jgi:hypothetical protein
MGAGGALGRELCTCGEPVGLVEEHGGEEEEEDARLGHQQVDQVVLHRRVRAVVRLTGGGEEGSVERRT